MTLLLSLVFVTLPYSLLRIGYRAFCKCHRLMDIRLPKRLVRIGDMAFSDCNALREISLPKSIEELGKNVFWRCASMRQAEILEVLKTKAEKLKLFNECPNMPGVPPEPEAPPVPPTPERLAGLSVAFLESWTTTQIVRRGEGYLEKVSAIRLEPSGKIVASVAGTKTYETRIWFDAAGSFHSHCSCPANPRCKHAVALALRCANGLPEN